MTAKLNRIRLRSFTLYFILLFIAYNISLSYPWPLRPSNQAHQVFSTLDECRGDGVRDHFHDGIDIYAYRGTTVIAVAAGYATAGGSYPNAYVTVDNRWWYVHLDDNTRRTGSVSVGDSLGKTNDKNHLHFAEGEDQKEVNPLRSGALSPECPDYYSPEIVDQYLLQDGNENQIVPSNNVTGIVDIVAQAKDGLNDPNRRNAGIYKIGYAIDSGNWIYKLQFDRWISSSRITNVYAPTSQTGTNKYKVTHDTLGNGFWDSRTVSDGWHNIYIRAHDIYGTVPTTVIWAIYVNNGTYIEEATDIGNICRSFRLSENYPNPFYNLTLIPFQLPKESEISLIIYSKAGQKVRTLKQGKLSPGYHKIVWDGRDDLGRKVPIGIYFCCFETNEFKEIRKMVLIK